MRAKKCQAIDNYLRDSPESVHLVTLLAITPRNALVMSDVAEAMYNSISDIDADLVICMP